MASAGQSAAARATGRISEQTRLGLAWTRTWCSQNGERHVNAVEQVQRAKMEVDCYSHGNTPSWRG